LQLPEGVRNTLDSTLLVRVADEMAQNMNSVTQAMSLITKHLRTAAGEIFGEGAAIWLAAAHAMPLSTFFSLGGVPESRRFVT
jgi:hypothetical protein